MVFFLMDNISIKPLKKSPASLKMYGCIMCNVLWYLYIFRLSKANYQTSTNFLNFEVIWTYYHDNSVDKTQIPHLHYPKPTTFSRVECGCNLVWLFTILSIQRSGSGLFETLLNSHNNVSSNGEIFSAIKRRNNVSLIFSTLDKVYNLDWFTSASKNQCYAAIGFKWMLNQTAVRNA
ncbi:hypothetical protein ACS0TY_017919 [Phlomoides rotata]